MNKQIIRRTAAATFTQDNTLHPLLQRIYVGRGVQSQTEIKRDLQQLLSYHLLSNIDTAVACLVTALHQQQSILIVGDFDTDGATSCALAVAALQRLGAKQVSYLVPNRFEYGYGLTPEIVDVAASRKPDVIITVDNGISSIEGVTRANELGIKVVVTDHHLPGDELPRAAAIVNPNLPNDLFPSKNLAGVGVIFYVMLALRNRLRELDWFKNQSIADPNMADFLDLVALGTIADVVVLDQNNRILIHQGLCRIRAGKCRVGIRALLEIGNRNLAQLTASDLGFVVAPRLNAAGRLDDISVGIACLLCEDAKQAAEIAAQLDTMNKERQVIENDMKNQAFAVLKQLRFQQNLPKGICIYDSSWHQGVIGILAGRIKDLYHRPAIAFAPVNDNELKGSARSVAGVHIRDLLSTIASQHPSLLTKFGGHAMAAGLSLERSNYEIFSQIFAEEVGRWLNEDDLQGKLYSDGELASDYFSLEIAAMLRDAGPWGQNFPEPIFDNIFYVMEQRLVGMRHLKLILKVAETNLLFDGIAFNVDLSQWPNYRCQRIRAAYRLDINEYRGQRRLQLQIEHLEALE